MAQPYIKSRIFEGSKNDWADFSKDVYLDIMSKGGKHAVDYLKTDHPQLPDGSYEFPAKYLHKEVPETPNLAANANANAVNVFNSIIKLIEIATKHNERLDDTIQAIFTAISTRLSRELNTPLGDDPTQGIYAYFRKLRTLYGPDTLDSTSLAARENKLERELVMDTKETFSGFIGRFNREWDALKATKDSKLAKITRMKKNNDNNPVLPARFVEHIEKAIRDRTNYDDTCKQFATVDDDYQKVQPNKKTNDTSDTVKKVKAVNYYEGTPKTNCALCMLILEKLNNYNACCADCHLASIGANNDIYSKASGGNKAKGDGRKLVPSHYDKRGNIKEHGKPWQRPNTRSNGNKNSSHNTSTSSNKNHNTNNKRKFNHQQRNNSNTNQSNVAAIYILDNGEEYDGDQTVDNHVDNYIEVSDNEGDDDNIPRAKSSRVRVITTKPKEMLPSASFEPRENYHRSAQQDITYSIKKVQRSSFRRSSNRSPSFNALIDTGSEANCAMTSMIPYLNKVKHYNSSQDCPQTLTAANEEGLKVVAEGRFSQVNSPVYVIENITQNILSPEALGLQLQTFHKPIVHNNKDIYCVLYDKQLNVKLVGDRNLVTDVSKYGNASYSDIDVVDILQDIKNTCQTNSIKRRIYLPYGYTYTTKSALVEFINQSFLYSKKDLLEAPDLINNFPINQQDIRKHFVKLQAYRDGHQRLAAKTNAPLGEPMSNSKESDIIHNINTSDIEYRNMILGFEVGSDQVGPYKGSAGLILVDKASNYVITEFYASKTIPSADKEPNNQTKSAVVKGLRLINNIYKKYNHPIQTLKSDSHSIFRSSVFQDTCNELSITQDLSSPGIKQRNGLAERSVGLNSERVTSMFRLAPYIPHVLWTFLFDLSNQISNMKRSRVLGSDISRMEEFTGIRPNYHKIPILPAGIPISCSVPKESREKFGSHSTVGMYIGVDPLAVSSIIVWIPATKRIIYTQSYEILSYNQAPYEWKTLDPFQGQDLMMRYNTNSVVEDEIEIVQNVVDDNSKQSDKEVSDRTSDNGNFNNDINDNRSISASDNRIITATDMRNISASDNRLISNTDNRNTNVIQTPTINPPPPNIVLPTVHPTNRTKQTAQKKTVQPVPSTKNTRSRTFSQKSAATPVRKSQRANATVTWKSGPVKFRQITNKKSSKFSCEVRTVFKIKKKNRSDDNPSYSSAMKSANSDEWLAAIQEEMDQMDSEEVYTYVKYDDLPSGANVIGSMFVLQRKRDKITGAITKYKARLCALGNQQKKSSFVDTKSQTVRSNSVKMLLTLKAKTKANAMVIDIKGAYLKSLIDKDLNEKLYIKLPDGRIARLNKYIYGLKQSGLQWQKNVTSFLESEGYVKTADPLVLIKRIKDQFIIVSLHVDDFLVISNNDKYMSQLQTLLKNKYKDITVQTGNTLQYLGLSIETHIDNSVSISQPAYVDKILDLAKSKWDLKPSKSPMATDQTFNNNSKHIKVDKLEYLKFVGSLNYLAMFSRPDLLYHLSRVAQSCSDPNESDMLRIKKIFSYILYTKGKKLYFNSNNNFNLECFVDASNNCYLDGKGHYGYGLCFGGCCFFLCKSAKIRMVTMSSTEAEYCALAYACMEILYIIQLLKDLGFYNGLPVKIFEDNQPVINMLHSDALNYNTTKHINPRFHFTKDLIKTGLIKIEKVPTADNIADIFTKALSSEQFEFLSDKLMK